MDDLKNTTSDEMEEPDSSYEDMDMEPAQAMALLSRIQTQGESKELNLSLCDLRTVPLEAIRVYHDGPTHLDLSHNMLTSLSPRFVEDMSNLYKLDLSRNFIKKLPGDFGRLRRLNYLDLHLNKLVSLPVSMCMLKNLNYLNISDNPLRPPLSDFLDMDVIKREGEDFKINVPHPIIQFLRTVVDASGDTTENRLVKVVPRRNVHFTPGGVQMEFDENDEANRNFANYGEPMSTTSYPQEKSPDELRKGSSQWFPTWLSGLFFLLLLIFMTPLVVAMFADHTYFENLAKTPGTFTPLWLFYKGIHSGASAIVLCHCRMNVPMNVQVPPAQPGIISAVLSSLYAMVSYIGNLFTFS